MLGTASQPARERLTHADAEADLVHDPSELAEGWPVTWSGQREEYSLPGGATRGQLRIAPLAQCHQEISSLLAGQPWDFQQGAVDTIGCPQARDGAYLISIHDFTLFCSCHTR